MVTITNLRTAARTPMEGRGETIRLVGEGTGARLVDVHVNVLRPRGARGRYHYHPDNENVYVVLNGRGHFVADGTEYTLGRDDVVFIPPGVKHSLSAAGEDDLILLEIYAPARMEMTYPG